MPNDIGTDKPDYSDDERHNHDVWEEQSHKCGHSNPFIIDTDKFRGEGLLVDTGEVASITLHVLVGAVCKLSTHLPDKGILELITHTVFVILVADGGIAPP